MRTGITRETPWGSGWVLIEQPSDKSGIKEIGAGNKVFWAIDYQGNVYYRAGITNQVPQGTKWVYLPASMSTISVSTSNQVLQIQSLVFKIFSLF